MKLMKTTLNLHDELLSEAKAFAVTQHLSLTRLIEEGLRMRIRGTDVAPVGLRRAMPVFHGSGGMVPGLSGLSTRELMDAADSDAA